MSESELRNSIRTRPGMYFGRGGAYAGVHNVVANAAIEARDLLCDELEVRQYNSGEITVRFGVSQRHSEIDISHLGAWLRHQGDLHPSLGAWKILRASCATFDGHVVNDRVHVSFIPDYESIPRMARFSGYPVLGALRDLATSTPGLRLSVSDERSGFSGAACYPHGALDRLSEEAGDRGLNCTLGFRGEKQSVSYDVGLAWCTGPGLQVVAITNGRRNANGGSHVQGVWEGVARAINRRVSDVQSQIRAKGHPREFEAEDIPRNVVLIICVNMANPGHEPGTRDCLHDDRARRALGSAVASRFFEQLGESASGSTPPWQLFGDVHASEPWVELLAKALCGSRPKLRPGDRDPYHHLRSTVRR